MSLSCRVLVVSGDYDACDALTAALDEAGFPVDAANDAATAADLIAQRDYGLLILEHWPPYLDAYRCAGRMKRWGTPTVILDGASPPAAESAASGGVVQILPRSTGPDELVAWAKVVLARSASKGSGAASLACAAG